MDFPIFLVSVQANVRARVSGYVCIHTHTCVCVWQIFGGHVQQWMSFVWYDDNDNYVSKPRYALPIAFYLDLTNAIMCECSGHP